MADLAVERGLTIATHAALPEGSPDDAALAAALCRRGVPVRFAPWNEPSVDWSASPLTVVRSTWDYHSDPRAWLAWIDAVAMATRVLNRPDVLRWNTDKRYLGALARRGIACVPSEFVEPGSIESMSSIVARRGWTDLVVKPAVAASAIGVRRFRGSAAASDAERHLRDLLRRGAALVQPYLPAVETEQERSLVFIAGEFVHAFRKPAFATDTLGTTAITPHAATSSERSIAAAAIAVAPGWTLYARVDLVPARSGTLVMELELIEPDLGLRLDPEAASRLADACTAALRTRSRSTAVQSPAR